MCDTIRNVFKGKLPTFALEQLDTIEKHFGKEVVFKKEKTGTIGAKLAAHIDDDNVPTITCDPEYIPEIDHILHEIWHLNIRALEKIKTYTVDDEDKFGAFIMKATDRNKKKAGLLFFELYNITDHHFFYPKLLSNNINPSKYFLGEFPKKEWETWNTDTCYDRNMYVLFTLQLFSIEGFTQTPKAIKLLQIARTKHPDLYAKAKKMWDVLSKFKNIDDHGDTLKELAKMLWDYPNQIKLTRRGDKIFLS